MKAFYHISLDYFLEFNEVVSRHLFGVSDQTESSPLVRELIANPLVRQLIKVEFLVFLFELSLIHI